MGRVGVVAVVPGEDHRHGRDGERERAGGLIVRSMFRAMPAKLADKVAADALVLGSGGTVFHAGPLRAGPLSPTAIAIPSTTDNVAGHRPVVGPRKISQKV